MRDNVLSLIELRALGNPLLSPIEPWINNNLILRHHIMLFFNKALKLLYVSLDSQQIWGSSMPSTFDKRFCTF